MVSYLYEDLTLEEALAVCFQEEIKNRLSKLDHALHIGDRANHRSMQRKTPMVRDDEARLTADIVELARQYGRYGYRKIAELLRTTAGWVVNDKRVERIWRLEG